MILTKRTTYSVLILIVFSFVFSCKNARQDYISTILSSGCFWDVLSKDFNATKVKYTYRFLPDGTCYMYSYIYLNEEKQNSASPMDKKKGEVDIKWYLKNDTLLNIGTVDYKVLKVDKSSIWLETLSTHSFMLQKNCSTFIKD